MNIKDVLFDLTYMAFFLFCIAIGTIAFLASWLVKGRRVEGRHIGR